MAKGRKASKSETAPGIDGRIGARLQALRTKHGLSRRELGTRIGVTFQQIEKYETGRSRIAASTLFALAQELGVAPSHFLDPMPAIAGTTVLEEEVIAFMKTAECTQLLQAVHAIPRAKVRRQIMLFLRGITGDEE